MEKVRLAVPDFKPSTSDAKNADLLKAFNDTLWNDLDNAGIFDMASKSFYPLAIPGNPADVQCGDAWVRQSGGGWQQCHGAGLAV
jgi:TolB protein